MQDNRVELNGVKVHPFTSHDELLTYVSQKKGILVAINAEKILHATEHTSYSGNSSAARGDAE